MTKICHMEANIVLQEPPSDPGRVVYHVSPTHRREQIERYGAIVAPNKHGGGEQHWMSARDKVYFWPTLKLAKLWAKFMGQYNPQDIWSCLAPIDYEEDSHWEIEGRGYKTEQALLLPRLV